MIHGIPQENELKTKLKNQKEDDASFEEFLKMSEDIIRATRLGNSQTWKITFKGVQMPKRIKTPIGDRNVYQYIQTNACTRCLETGHLAHQCQKRF